MNKISFNDFYIKYKVKRNPLHLNSPFENTMLDMDDPELDHLQAQPENKVWSIVDSKERLTLTPGLLYKNVIGYFVSNDPWINNKETYELL